MARHTPSEDFDLDPGLGDGPKKELDRRRRQEARREAKRLRKERHRLEENNNALSSTWAVALIAVIVVLVISLGAGGYYFWGVYTAGLQRKSFMDAYTVADLSMLARNAPSELSTVEDLKRVAVSMEGAFSYRDIAAKYHEAQEALGVALNQARVNADHYDAAMTRFQRLKKDAVKHHLPEYAKLLWRRIEEAEKVATDETAHGFSITLATEKLTQASNLLEKTAKNYPQLEKLGLARDRFEKAMEGLRPEECERNGAEVWATLQSQKKLAEAAMEATAWAEAARAYDKAADLIEPLRRKIVAMRGAAEEAMTLLRQVRKTAEKSGMPESNPILWRAVVNDMATCEAAFRKADYKQAKRLAEELTTRMGKAGERTRKARQELAGLRRDVETLFTAMKRDDEFYRRNWSDQWEKLQRSYGALPELMKQGDPETSIATLRDLKRNLAALAAEKTKVFTDLTSAEARLSAVVKSPLYAYLDPNYPELVVRIDALKTASRRHRERGDLRKARDELAEAAQTAEKGLATLGDDRTRALALRAAINQQRVEYQEGIRRFMAMQLTVVEQRARLLEKQIEHHLYRKAVATAETLHDMLPRERYVAGKNGTVVDYQKGIMWMADGTSPEGGNGGKPLDWYAALQWAAASRAAGFVDWELPTEEELRDLRRLPPAQRQRLFPHTIEGMHWSRVPSQNVHQALAVDVGTGRVTREDKKKRFHVRLVRQPALP